MKTAQAEIFQTVDFSGVIVVSETRNQNGSDLELDRGQLLGFRHLATFGAREAELAGSAGAAFNKRIAEVPPPAPNK